MRSLLCIDVARELSLDAALASGADALVLAGLEAEGGSLPAWLAEAAQLDDRPLLYLRLDADRLDDETLDLAGRLACEPDGIVLAGCRASSDVQHLGAKLAVCEAELGLSDGCIAILAEPGASARGLSDLARYTGCSDRLMALAWDPGALAADLGADVLRDPGGRLTGPLETARALTLFAARAAGVAAVDGAEPELDEEGLRAACMAARRDGFNARMTTRIADVAIINAVFDPAA